MYEAYSKAIQEQVIPHLNEVCKTKETWKAELHFPVGALVEEAKKDGFTLDDEYRDFLDTNGWQWDWWFNLEKDGEHYTMGGSGYYGGLSFFVKEE
jgi:hypothetical protein